jgi:integrase
MASFRTRPDGSIQVEIRKKNFPYTCKTFENKTDAKNWAALIESEMVRGVYFDRSESESTSFKDALDRYEREVSIHKKGYDTEKYRIGKWKRNKQLSSKSLAALRSSDFSKYRDECLAEGLSAATIRNDLALVSHLFTVANQDWGIQVVNPISSVRMPREDNSRDRLFVGDEEERILASVRLASKYAQDRCNVWIEPLYMIAIETAARQSELLNIKWNDINFTDFYVHFPDTKIGTQRDVPLSEKAISLLKNLPKDFVKKTRSKDAIKESKIKDLNYEQRVFKTTSSAVKQSWSRAVKRARREYEKELKALGKSDQEILEDKLLIDYHFHDLRHEGTTRLASIFGLHDLMKITGHKDTRTLNRYYHPKAKDLALMMRNHNKSKESNPT